MSLGSVPGCVWGVLLEIFHKSMENQRKLIGSIENLRNILDPEGCFDAQVQCFQGVGLHEGNALPTHSNGGNALPTHSNGAKLFSKWSLNEALVGLLGASWRRLAVSWDALEVPWHPLGVSGGRVVASSGPLDGLMRPHAGLLGRLGVSWERRGVRLGGFSWKSFENLWKIKGHSEDQ